jgi:hypothetical protein
MRRYLVRLADAKLISVLASRTRWLRGSLIERDRAIEVDMGLCGCSNEKLSAGSHFVGDEIRFVATYLLGSPEYFVGKGLTGLVVRAGRFVQPDEIEDGI